MSADQNWSRCRRQTSRSICRHSRARLDRDAHAVEVDPAALARRRAVVRRRARACSGLRSAAIARRRLPSRTTSVVPSLRQREGVDLVGEGLGAAGREVEALELAGRFLVAAAAVRADDVLHASRSPCAPATPAIWPKRFSRPETPPRGCAMPSRSTRIGAARGRRFGVAAAASRSASAVRPLRRRLERRPAAGLQRDQVGPRRAREAELELDAVVDRVEGAQRQEVEVLAVGIERRAT